MTRTFLLFFAIALGVGLIYGLQLIGVLPETTKLLNRDELAAIESPHIVFFEKEDCSRCRNMKKSLARLLEEFPDVSYVLYDVDKDQALMQQLMIFHGLEGAQKLYPVIFVGESVVVGEGRTEELALRTAMASCQSDGCPSPLDLLDASR